MAEQNDDGKAGGEVALRQENELLRTALRFYARGDNYHLDESEEFDTVSGEPQNWLCSGVEDSETMIENGEVARHTLMGHVIGWEDAEEDHTPQPIAGEAPFSAAALQTAYNTRPQQAAQVAQPLTEQMEAQVVRYPSPHRKSAFRDGWRSAEAAHRITGDGRGEAAPKATMFHDAGAIAQCGHCQRYTLDRKALSDRQPVCTCGKQHYWSGSFKPPTTDAKWHGPAPATPPQQEQAAPGAVPIESTKEIRNLPEDRINGGLGFLATPAPGFEPQPPKGKDPQAC